MPHHETLKNGRGYIIKWKQWRGGGDWRYGGRWRWWETTTKSPHGNLGWHLFISEWAKSFQVKIPSHRQPQLLLIFLLCVLLPLFLQTLVDLFQLHILSTGCASTCELLSEWHWLDVDSICIQSSSRMIINSLLNQRCEGVCRAWRQEVHNLVATGKLQRYFHLFSCPADSTIGDLINDWLTLWVSRFL